MLFKHIKRWVRRKVGSEMLIWSDYGATVEFYDLERDPEQKQVLWDVDEDRTARMLGLFDAVLRYWTVPVKANPSKETRERLHALGYMR